MQSSISKRLFVIVLFAGLLGAAFFLAKSGKRSESGSSTGVPSAPDANAALARYGFSMEDGTRQSGIQFTHSAPKLDSRLDHIMPQVAGMGAAVSISDFDRDGFQDVFLINSGEGSQCALYRNLGNGSFKDVTAEVGLKDLNMTGLGVCTGAVWGDYDNDGFEDLLVYRWGKISLFHSEGGKSFKVVSPEVGFPAWMNANSAIWLDYDNDGKLDLFVAGYFPDEVNLWNLATTKIMPESFEYARNGGRKYLYHNLGGGKWEEVALKLGIDSKRWTLAAVAADLRGTGYPDLFLSNDYGVSEVYANQGGKGFVEIGKKLGIARSPKSGMNASIGDVLNTGAFSIYVSNITEEGILIQGNNLWVPKEGTRGDNLTYENLAPAMGVDNGGWSFGAQFGDLNNDGFLDLYLVNGFVSADKEKNYWYDYGKITGANTGIIQDAANWPPMNGRSLAGYQQKKVWLNDGAGKFTEISQVIGVTDRNDGRSVALADFTNSGVLDAVVANQKGPVLYYKNRVDPKNQWIAFELEGVRSNRSAIGAQVRLHFNGQVQLQEVSGGCGFCAQNMRRLHFGVGKDPKVERVEIRWPSGKTQSIPTPKVGKIHKLKEPE